MSQTSVDGGIVFPPDVKDVSFDMNTNELFKVLRVSYSLYF